MNRPARRTFPVSPVEFMVMHERAVQAPDYLDVPDNLTGECRNILRQVGATFEASGQLFEVAADAVQRIDVAVEVLNPSPANVPSSTPS